MIREKTHLEKINAVLALLAEVNHILTQPATQADAFQQTQYQRQKNQYVNQLTDLLSGTTQPLIVAEKRPPRAA